MDINSGVQQQDEPVVQSNEGAGDTGSATCGLQTAIEQARAEATGQPPVVEEPPVDETIPPELRPDKDGNPPKLTAELMRKLRGKYFTVRHPVLQDCGHKLDMINEPRHRNCENCWWAWFNSHGPLVETADQMYRTLGPKAVEALRGVTFVKMFKRFMATVYHFQQQMEKANESGNQSAEAAVVDGEEVSSLSSSVVAE